MSKEGLKEVLEYEKFTDEQILYVIQNNEIDYYEQAVSAALKYKYSLNAAKEESIKYLINDKFTNEEIEYTVNLIYEKSKE